MRSQLVVLFYYRKHRSPQCFCHQSLSRSSKNKKHILEGKTERQNRCLRFGTSLKQDSHPKVWAKSSFPLGNAGNCSMLHSCTPHKPFKVNLLFPLKVRTTSRGSFRLAEIIYWLGAIFRSRVRAASWGKEEPSAILASRLDTLLRAPSRLPYRPKKEQLHRHGMTPFWVLILKVRG